MDKERVALTVKERLELAQGVSIGKAAARKLTHARILLLAEARCGEAEADAEIVWALGTSPRTIERLRQRCVTAGLAAALDHRPQPPRPDKVKIKGTVDQTLLELACSEPPRGRCHWTLPLLAAELVVLGLIDTISTVTVWQALEKNDSKPWIVKTWCVPPKAEAEFVWRREDVLQTSRLPYDPRYPVVCFDAACKQLFGEVRPAQRPRRGRAARRDYEYERKGGCHQWMLGEPWRGWRHVKVTARRTRRDYAECLRALVAMHCPQAQRMRLVQDTLNTHDGASLYAPFAPEEARRILDKIALHYTPKHGSWLNMAETESNIMKSQCLNRWLESQALIAAAVAAWDKKRNLAKARIHWTCTLAAARRKLRKLYPSIED